MPAPCGWKPCDHFLHVSSTYPYQRDVENIVDAILGEITDALARFDRVELRGFGVFLTKQRRARTGRNPRSGDSVQVTEKHVPAFKTGKEVRELLNRR